MGNKYTAPPKTGPAETTRSGEPIPKLKVPGKGPYHRGQDLMSLQMHLTETRQRTKGLTPEERVWRKKFVLDQKLHPDEPIRVEAVYRQLNPVRRLYRYPWDALYEHVLEPKLGAFHATFLRAVVPKLLLCMVGVYWGWYFLKYESKDWTQSLGVTQHTPKYIIHRRQALDAIDPGLYDKGMNTPKVSQDYSDEGFKQRSVYLTLGPSQRPW